MADEYDPWADAPDWGPEEWRIEWCRRKAEQDEYWAKQQAEAEANLARYRERRERWKATVGDMSPSQIGDMLLALRRGGKTVPEICEIVGNSPASIRKYMKMGASYGG